MNILNYCSKGATFYPHKGLVWSLGESNGWERMEKRRVLLVLLFLNENCVFSPWTYLKTVKNWRGKRSIYALAEDCILVQVRIVPMRIDTLQIGQMIPGYVHVLCVYTRKYFIPHLFCTLRVGVIGTHARWLITFSCLWDNNKLQAARVSSR